MAVRKQRADGELPGAPDNVIEAPMTPRRITVSDILRNRRFECGLDVDYVAEILRIRPAVLAAIENGEFYQLPGPAYAVGFVRSYATYLGLDAEALVVRFKNETTEVARRPHLTFPLPIRDSRVPTGPLLIICILLAIVTYGGWYYLSAKPDQMANIVPAVPERLQRLLAVPPPHSETPAGAPQQSQSPAAPTPSPEAVAPPQVAATVPTPQSSAALPTPPAPAAAQPTAVDGVPPVENRAGAAPATVASLPAAPDLAQPPVAGDSAKPPGDTSYGAPEGQARVVLHAIADSWVQVRDKGSNLLFTRVLKPGEHYNVPNQPGLTLIAGNAGGLDITVDGMNAPSIGEAGRVARNISLDPDHLLGAQTHAN